MMNTGADACVLLLDTSGDIGTVALAVDGALRSVQTMERAQDYAAVLNETIAAALADGGARMNELTAVCVMAGPGSYTGLRIAMAAAKGLCYALDIALYLQNGLHVLAEEAHVVNPDYDAYLSIVPARKGEYFFAAYNQDGIALVEPQHLKLEDAAHLLQSLPGNQFIVGNGVSASEVFLEKVPSLLERTAPSTHTWLTVALHQIRTTAPADLAYAEPFYLKPAYTTTPKASR